MALVVPSLSLQFYNLHITLILPISDRKSWSQFILLMQGYLYYEIHNVFERNDMTGRVIIKTPDTDVLVLAIHYYPQMDRVKEFWIETGTVTRTTDLRRFIPVHDICHSQSPLFLKVLPAIHALTGCDSTSDFFGIGKNSVYKTISEKEVGSFAELVFLGGEDENTSIV